jgi:hypothetical protein
MSTRSSIWLAAYGGKCVHIYWELGDRDIEQGQRIGRMAAPVYIAADEGDTNKEVAVRLPKAAAEEILKALCPNYRAGHEII